MSSIYDQEAPSSVYLKFASGDVHRIRLFGEPTAFLKSFREGEEPKQRFASLVLFRNKDSKKNECRVFEFGWEIQKRLKALNKDADWGDPTTYDVEITATGDGLSREYQVVPKPKKDLSDGEKALIAACDLKLGPQARDEAVPPPGDSDYDAFADD